MDDAFAMDVLETMAIVLEVLVTRIEVLEKKATEQCVCKNWQEHAQLQRENELGNKHAA